MTNEEILKIRFVETTYKQFDFGFSEETEISEEEPNWEGMGLTPQGHPLDDDMELDYEWVPITIDIAEVWGVSPYEDEVIIWVGGRSLSIDMPLDEALEKFLHAKLHI